MNNISSITKIGMLTLMIALASPAIQGQTRYTPNTPSKITIAGTSTLHDWTMASSETTYEAQFEVDADGAPVRLASLTFTVPAESLKSGKGAMDKNAYSALKTDTYKQIAFQLSSASMDAKTIQCAGKLKVAGVTKQVEVDVTYTLLPGNIIQCKGTKKIKMTDYGVEPPSFMFGSVTTGDEITISFEVTLAPRDVKTVSLN
jgi:polyisoprenoid-binding protein YceI